MGIFKVLIDTNIYDGANYSFDNAKFSTIKEFANKGYFTLLINSVIYEEVVKHIKENTNKAINEIKKTIKNYSRALTPFRNAEPYQSQLFAIDKKQMIDYCLNGFSTFLNSCNTETITSNGIDVEEMIKDYANKNSPFEEAKPEEFKDAIIIRSFLQYYNEHLSEITDGKVHLCAISQDKGFINGLSRLLPSDYKVTILKDINDLIANINSFDRRIKALSNYLTQPDFQEEILDKIKESLEQKPFYVADPTDELDLIDITNITYQLLWVDIENENSGKAAFSVDAEIKIWYTYTDEDSSYYDKEDRCYYWKTEIEKEESHRIDFEIILGLDTTSFGDHSEESDDDYNFDDDSVDIVEIVDATNDILLDDETCISSDVRTYDPFSEDEDGREYAFDTCPICGTPIGIKNDGGNGFCINCAKDK